MLHTKVDPYIPLILKYLHGDNLTHCLISERWGLQENSPVHIWSLNHVNRPLDHRMIRAIPFEKVGGGGLLHIDKNTAGWSENNSHITAGWSDGPFLHRVYVKNEKLHTRKAKGPPSFIAGKNHVAMI